MTHLDDTLLWLQSRAPYLARLGVAVRDGRVSSGRPPLHGEEFAVPPAMLPVLHPRLEDCVGYWVFDPVGARGRCVHLFLDTPATRGAVLDSVGLLDALRAVATEESDERAMELIGLLFPGSRCDEQEDLLESLGGATLADVGELRSMPLVAALVPTDDQPLPPVLAELSRRRPPDATGQARRSQFEQCMAADDVAGAWDALNQPGWSYESMTAALGSLMPLLEPSFASLLVEKMRPERYGPVHGD